MPIRPLFCALSPFGLLSRRFLILALLVFAFPLEASERIASFTIQDSKESSSRSRVTVDSMFGKPGTQGFVPITLTITNKQDRDVPLTLVLDTRDDVRSYPPPTESEFTVIAPARRESVHSLLVPFSGSGSYNYLGGRILFGQAPPKTFQIYGEQNERFPTLAVSENLAHRSLNELNDAAKDKFGREKFGASFTPEQLRSDWRTLTSQDGILIDFEEWNDLSKNQQEALLLWVHQGGFLAIYHTDIQRALKQVTDDWPSMNLPVSAYRVRENMSSEIAHNLGLGVLRFREWDGSTLTKGEIAALTTVEKRRSTLKDGFKSEKQFGLLADYQGLSKGGGLMLIFLTLFAVAVGPLNLFVFARSGRRHRIFITTPIISAIAAALIFASIWLKDGAGGSGNRVVLAELIPGTKSSAASSESGGRQFLSIRQEQISKTGMIFRPGFKPSEESIIEPIVRTSASMSKIPPRYLADGSYERGFFSSRSEQALSVRSVFPTRTGLEWEFTSGDSPSVSVKSRLPFAVRNLQFFDNEGQRWSAKDEALEPGGELQLSLTDEKKASSTLLPLFGKGTRSQVERFLKQKTPHFLAEAAAEGALSIETHPSIRWKEAGTLLIGTVTTTIE